MALMLPDEPLSPVCAAGLIELGSPEFVHKRRGVHHGHRLSGPGRLHGRAHIRDPPDVGYKNAARGGIRHTGARAADVQQTRRCVSVEDKSSMAHLLLILVVVA